MNKKPFSPAFMLALCALMAALGTVIMLSSGVIPILTYASPLIAGLTLIPVLYEFGSKYAWMTWLVTALLSLMICADREAAFFYLFLGYYPIVKLRLDRIPSKTVRIAAKLGTVSAGICLLFLLLTFVLGLEDMKSELLLNIAVYGMLIGVMMIYDRTLDRMMLVYVKRLRDRLIRKN
ncbi:MAG: hypothetical protein IJV40_12885 [Oscillospiraceae bacterium]|nr:hypothetical protein [Oscillospiraceae bacterium]